MNALTKTEFAFTNGSAFLYRSTPVFILSKKMAVIVIMYTIACIIRTIYLQKSYPYAKPNLNKYLKNSKDYGGKKNVLNKKVRQHEKR